MSTRKQQRQALSSRPDLINTCTPKRFATDEGIEKCDPTSIANKFSSVTDAPDRFRDPLPECDLPSFGDAYDDCSDDFYLVCSNCGDTFQTPRKCYRSQCPHCSPWWALRQGTKIASKLEATRLVKESNEGAGWSGYKLHHLSLSPPDGFAVDSDDPLQFTFDLLKEVLGDIGAVGGALFYHPYREADEGAVDVADVGEFWPEILFNDDHNSMEDVEDQLSFEPHFHAIVVAKYIPGGELVSKINHESGWVIKRITKGGDESDSTVSLYDEYDLTRASTYCLSHTGLYDTKNGTHAAYRYFGETANLQPRDHTEAKIDSAARSVAPKTLGLPFSDLSCSNSAPDNYADDARVSSVESVFSHSQGPVKTLSDDQSPDGSQTDSGAGDSDFIGPSPDDTDSTDSSADRCAGRLLPITKAPALLEDEDWRESAQHIDKLRDTWKKWRDRVDTPPPDPPPGPQ